LIILRLTVLPHKHPHELLDSVVKEQWLSLSSQPRRAFYSSLIFRQVVFRSYFLSTQPLAPPISFWHLVSGRRILQRFKPLSTTSFTASDHLDRNTDKLKPPPCQPDAFYTAFAALQPLFLR
ncbi:hypothetical protein P8H27_19535, partial [Pseudomonas sp. sp1636]|uniref:hypothetical protein n=1 Tax=Pseudomonas sp. sp1636 TaxID=3036707 RepID=UPI0025A50F48